MGSLEQTGVLGEFNMRDLANYRTDRRIARVEHDRSRVSMTWNNGPRTDLLAIWLRDNCACAVCRHPLTMERTFQLLEHPMPILIREAYLSSDGTLAVAFEAAEGVLHKSRFTAGWLWHHRPRVGPLAASPVTARLWIAADLARIPTFSFDKVMRDDDTLDSWLCDLTDWGVTLVEDMPDVKGTVEQLAARVGPLRPTNFGTVFEVESKPNPNNAAYTAMGLEPHTDIPNVPYPPGIQLLHCIVNDARGGGSILVDGFRVAEELRRASETDFRLLADHPITFRFHDAEVDLIHYAPVIRVDSDDSVVEIRFSNWLRGTLDFPPSLVGPYYGALMRYWELLRQPTFQLRPRLAAGQAFVFDNQRVLHGREPFDPQTGGRLLQGCYVDHETLKSRRRVIARGRAAHRAT
jgi:gamma-butyrobetaine dioxygenase